MYEKYFFLKHQRFEGISSQNNDDLRDERGFVVSFIYLIY